MHCPNCGGNDLIQQEPAPSLVTLRCNGCQGHWIQASRYWAWIEKNGQNFPLREANDDAFRLVESSKARICPECGCIMCRHEVGHGVPFAIDRCSACGGFWLDRGEFEALQRRNLHDDIHFVFSQAWQQTVLRQKENEQYEQRIQGLLGRDDYEEARRVKAWLAKHPKRAALAAYLMGR